MRALVRRLRIQPEESGLGLVELIVALMIFAIIATGIGYTLLASLSLTKDSTAREQASNLAAQEIDLSRSIDNLFNLQTKTTTTTINGITYTIVRTAKWVSDPSVDQRCGIGGGILRYKRVNVAVSWTGMTSLSAPVKADTLIDPGVRINDPDLGTVLISVTDSQGNPVVGATANVVPASPANGAQPLSAQPAVTDSEGCTYALEVTPGNYTVTVSNSGYVDVNQNATPSSVVSVEASSASAAMMTLDLGANFPINYLTNYTGPDTVYIPADLKVSFLSTYGTSVITGTPATVVRFPFTAGYTILAGTYQDPSDPSKFCKSVDPQEWAAGTISGVNYDAGVRPPAVAAVPGGTADTANLGMGVVQVPIPYRSGSTNWYVKATSVSTGPTGSADPGCNISTTYILGPFKRNNTYILSLPYGTWNLYTQKSDGTSSQTLTPSTMTLLTNGQLNSDSITLDPRVVIP